MIIRACQTCKMVKETTEFSKNGYNCKVCEKNLQLIRNYNINITEWLNLRQAQNYKCHICETSEEELGRPLFVDHCHGTGKVRGMLCSRCNSGLGFFRDNINWLVKGVEYLEKYRK